MCRFLDSLGVGREGRRGGEEWGWKGGPSSVILTVPLAVKCFVICGLSSNVDWLAARKQDDKCILPTRCDY